MVTLAGCGNETSKEQVEAEMIERTEDGKEIVVEPLDESTEEDVAKRMEIQEELKSSIAEITSLEEETINVMLSFNEPASCSIVLETDATIEDSMIEEIKQMIVQRVAKENIALSEEAIVITNGNGEIQS